VHVRPEAVAEAAREVLGVAGGPDAELEPPTAIVCTSDALALAVVGAARDAGLSVPGDVSVVGFDDSPLAALASPALTSVRVDYAEFGAAAAGALLAAINGAPAPAYSPSAPELVPRASTATARR
jgi:LacI family transcriptional regulator, repressor for deo operon, udp, cdd, tsx, nupC, and nupG